MDNISYLLSYFKDLLIDHKVLLNGEPASGKTFISCFIAYLKAIQGKQVCLIGDCARLEFILSMIIDAFGNSNKLKLDINSYERFKKCFKGLTYTSIVMDDSQFLERNIFYLFELSGITDIFVSNQIPYTYKSISKFSNHSQHSMVQFADMHWICTSNKVYSTINCHKNRFCHNPSPIIFPFCEPIKLINKIKTIQLLK